MVLIMLASGFSMTVSAQKVYYSDPTNRWSLTYDPTVVNSTGTQYYQKDTVFNGFVYRQLNRPGMPWVREDIITGKVYFTVDFNGPEFLLYDYNLFPGDTLKVYHSGITFTSDTSAFVLLDIDTILINGTQHKVQSFSIDGENKDAIVIEGLGSLEDGFVLVGPHPNPGILITCFENKGIRPTIAPKVGILDNTQSCLLMNVDDANISGRTQIIPHPANHSSSMIFSVATSGVLRIFDALGRRIASEHLSNVTSLPLINYLTTKGIYYYHLQDTANGRDIAGKIIFE